METSQIGILKWNEMNEIVTLKSILQQQKIQFNSKLIQIALLSVKVFFFSCQFQRNDNKDDAFNTLGD